MKHLIERVWEDRLARRGQILKRETAAEFVYDPAWGKAANAVGHTGI